MFFKRKKTIARYFYVPAEHVEQFCKLFDTLRLTGGSADRYRLWKFIEHVMPGAHGTICFPKATTPALRYEVVED